VLENTASRLHTLVLTTFACIHSLEAPFGSVVSTSTGNCSWVSLSHVHDPASGYWEGVELCFAAES
jgi:hypothetical protein